MTGLDRLTSVLKAYTEGSGVGYKARPTSVQVQDTVQISSEGLQKSKAFLAGLNSETSPEEVASSEEVPSSPPQASVNLEILNLSSNASMDQIHKAYLSAIKQYHPDKFNAYGPEFTKLAEEKSKQINLAYKKLTKFSG